MSSGAGVAFAGALQASLSVLLTITVGVVSAQYGLFSIEAAEDVSRISVQVFLPCLLIENLGRNLSRDTAEDYVPLIVWATIYTVLSIAIGRVLTVVFKLPPWATPSLAFNNTESLPLLLLQALGTTGTLAVLSGEGKEDEAIERARSFFLAASVITNTITFGKGPEILQSSADHSMVGKAWRWLAGPQTAKQDSDSESGGDDNDEGDDDDNDDENENNNGGGSEEEAHEQTSLLPRPVNDTGHKAKRAIVPRLKQWHAALPGPVQSFVSGLGMLLNAPFIGALIGVTIGLTPALQTLFFADMADGGYFNAWLTTSIKNVGELFVAIQVVVVGVKLSLSLRKWKVGDDGGSVPMESFAIISIVRFFIWPAISIPLVWVLAAKTDVLPNDPILWWAMMMLPVGPPAMKILALAEMSGSSQKVKMAIARLLTLSYMITPLISLSVVGALEAAKSAKEQRS